MMAINLKNYASIYRNYWMVNNRFNSPSSFRRKKDSRAFQRIGWGSQRIQKSQPQWFQTKLNWFYFHNVDNFVSSESAELSAALKKYYPFISELRKRIIYTVGVFLLATITGFVFYEQIIKYLIDILSLRGVNVVFTSPFQFINLSISCGLATGLVTVFPLIIFQLLSFLRPALKRKEFQTVASFIPLAIVLFVAGFSFGILIMRWQIQIFLSRASSLEIGNILDISSILSTVLLTSVIMGIGFQFPIVLYLLMKLGVLQPSHLHKWRKWVYLGSFIFAIMLPLDSVIADLLLTLPMIFLFELTLILFFIFSRKTPKIAKT